MAVVIQLNVEAFEEAQGKKKFKEGDLAKLMDLHPSTIWRTKAKKIPPGAMFIAGALKIFPEKRFEDLFFLA